MEENPHLRVWGVTRKTAECVLIWFWSDALRKEEWRNLELAWCDGAWSCRPVGGRWQQIMVFVPEVDE